MVRETGKRRGSRIELDYYRGSDGLSRWRGRLCLLVFLAVAGWVGLEGIASRDRADRSTFLRAEPARLQGPAGPGPRDVGFDLRGMPPAVYSDQSFTLGTGARDRLDCK